MPRRLATRRASSTAFSEQHPPWRAASTESSRGHCCSVTPTTSCPWAWSSAAATDESTPPDIATATLMSFPSPLAGEGQGGGIQASLANQRDVPRHHLGVLAHAVEHRRLRLALEMHAHEVQAWHSAAAIHLDRKTHVIEHREVDPVVSGAVSAGPDDGADSVALDVELGATRDPQRRRQLKGNWHPFACAERIDVLHQDAGHVVARGDALSQVVDEVDLAVLGTREPSDQLHPHLVQRPVVQVVPAAMPGRLRL